MFRMVAGAVLTMGALAGCVVQDADKEGEATTAAAPAAGAPAAGPATPMPGDTTGTQPAAPPQAPPDMSLEVNIAERELYVYRGGQRVATHPVAVGSREWPTPTGEWTVGQVVWNPRWIPPKEESWAEDEEEKEPGDPENPLGRAQLVYRAPNSIHGTNEPESLGKAVSHGSIRVSNEVAMTLARQVMEAGGAGKDEAWYQQARSNRRERQDVAIPNPVPIRVVSGGGSGSGGETEKEKEKGKG